MLTSYREIDKDLGKNIGVLLVKSVNMKKKLQISFHEYLLKKIECVVILTG